MSTQLAGSFVQIGTPADCQFGFRITRLANVRHEIISPILPTVTILFFATFTIHISVFFSAVDDKLFPAQLSWQI